MGFIAVYITNESQDAAQSIANQLLASRLIACANIFPIQASYHWQGQIANENEYVALVKTIPEHWEKLKTKVTEIHPYQVPCIMKIEVEANDEYEAWIRAEVRHGE